MNNHDYFSFTPENMIEAKKIIGKYPLGKQASAILPLLDMAQRQCGNWLPSAAIVHVAEMIGVPEIRAFEVASFYTMFNLQPVGKYLVQLCRTTPCWLAGGEAIARACEEKLAIKIGETTEDGLFTLKEVECLGACVNAPVMQINDDMYEDLSPESAAQILDDLAHGKKPKTGSQTGRCGGCPCGGATTLRKEGRDA
jgi:NADH-quinone oxidoreductase subunit E